MVQPVDVALQYLQDGDSVDVFDKSIDAMRQGIFKGQKASNPDYYWVEIPYSDHPALILVTKNLLIKR